MDISNRAVFNNRHKGPFMNHVDTFSCIVYGLSKQGEVVQPRKCPHSLGTELL